VIVVPPVDGRKIVFGLATDDRVVSVSANAREAAGDRTSGAHST